jgi:hypothetical protein
MKTPEQKFANYSNASKLRQSKIAPERRSEIARKAALAKWANISQPERRKHALLMVEGRIWKNK